MAEAIISRRGGAVFEEEVHSSWYSLTSPFLIGAKNALIGLCPNPSYPSSGTSNGIIVSVVIEGGEITSAYYMYNKNSAGIHHLKDLSFDPLTGTLSKLGSTDGEFSTIIDYKVVVY